MKKDDLDTCKEFRGRVIDGIIGSLMECVEEGYFSVEVPYVSTAIEFSRACATYNNS